MSESMESLIEKSRTGDAKAKTALGKRLLFGDGTAPSPQQGIALLNEAAEQSDGEALTLVARLAAWGVMRPRDLPLALDFLMQSAICGWAPAETELRFLAREAADSGGEDLFQSLRRRIDIDAWLQSPPSRIALDRPRVRIFESFATHAECDWIIDRLRGDLERAKVYRGAADPMVADTRTNSEAGFMLKSSDLPMCLIRNRIAAALRVAPEFCEVTKLLHYLPGQTFKLHTDYMDPAIPALRKEIAQRGQRYATFLLYLSDDYEGGETDFPHVQFRYKGRKGDALLFFSVNETGAPEPLSAHAGLPPTSGEKWVLSQWIGSRSMNVFMTPGAAPPPLGPDWLKSFAT